MRPYVLAIFLVIISILISAKTVNSLDNSDCLEYEFVFARGSGQVLNDIDYRTFKTEVDAALKNKNIRYGYYELGTKNGGYPAFAPNNVFSVLGAYISAGESYKFGESVEKGAKELITRLKSETGRCKNQKYIISGYSQGAYAVDRALPYLNSEKIFYVATFGDPKLYLPEGRSRNACNGLGLSNYRVYVPDCEVEEGVLGGIKPYESASLKNKRGAWCNQNDFVCGSRLIFTNLWKGHTAYINENGYRKFAQLISDKIVNATGSSSEIKARYSEANKRDVVVLYDCRGKLISEAFKRQLVEIAEYGTRVAIYNVYAYTNSLKILEEKVSFTNDHLGEKIDNLNHEIMLSVGNIVGRGNNLPYAIKEVSKKTKWEKGSERNIYIYSNGDYDDKESFDGTTMVNAALVAKENKVKISILGEGKNLGDTILSQVADATGGEMIGGDYSKIILNANQTERESRYFSKTFDLNRDSKYTLVIINDLIYGVTDKNKITIKDLDGGRLNVISFLEYDSGGSLIHQKTFRTGTEKVPDSGKVKL